MCRLAWHLDQPLIPAGWFRCDESVKMGRPQSNDELLQLIKQSIKVKAAGVGHSW